MPTRALMPAVFALFTVVACSPAPDTSSSPGSRIGAEAAIDSVLARYVAAVEAGDTAALAETFAEDVEVLFPTGPMIRRRADATAAFAELFSGTSVRGLERSATNRIIGEDVAVETGAFSITLQPKSDQEAPTVTDVGYYLMVWERQDDGRWMIARAFNRSDAPLAAVPAAAIPR